jgi:hypothetical protein
VQRAVEESVERLLSSTSGDFERSVGRPLFKDITDGLLIEIQQVVIKAGEAALPKALSQLAKKRLMLWAVLDSLRSPVVLSGADADRAGGRIWKQAQRVSAAISSTAAACASRREAAAAAGAAAAADPDLQAALVAELAAIDAGEKRKLHELQYEVYTGLHEVAAVVPDAAPFQVLMDLPKPHDTAIPTHSSTGVRYPDLIPEPSPAEPLPIPPIPPDLAASLSRDAVQLLFSEMGESSVMEGEAPDAWWKYGLPLFVNHLTRQLARSESEVVRMDKDFNAYKDLTSAYAQQQKALIQLTQQQIEELSRELELAQAKVEVLSEVLSRKNA